MRSPGSQRYVVSGRGKPVAAVIPADGFQDLIQFVSPGVPSEIEGIPVRVRFEGVDTAL